MRLQDCPICCLNVLRNKGAYRQGGVFDLSAPLSDPRQGKLDFGELRHPPLRDPAVGGLHTLTLININPFP